MRRTGQISRRPSEQMYEATCAQHDSSRLRAQRCVQEEEVPLPRDPLAMVLHRPGSEGQSSERAQRPPQGSPRRAAGSEGQSSERAPQRATVSPRRAAGSGAQSSERAPGAASSEGQTSERRPKVEPKASPRRPAPEIADAMLQQFRERATQRRQEQQQREEQEQERSRSRQLPPPPPPPRGSEDYSADPPGPPGTQLTVTLYVNGWTLFGLTREGQRSEAAALHMREARS